MRAAQGSVLPSRDKKFGHPAGSAVGVDSWGVKLEALTHTSAGGSADANGPKRAWGPSLRCGQIRSMLSGEEVVVEVLSPGVEVSGMTRTDYHFRFFFTICSIMESS